CVVKSLRRVPEPTYPRFPAAEYAERSRKAREIMKRRGIDVLLMTERENVVYFTGLATPEWVQKGTVVAAVMIEADSDEPIMVLPDFFFGMAEKSTWVNDYVLHRNSHSNQLDFANLLASTIKERGWSGSSIGYEAGTETL